MARIMWSMSRFLSLGLLLSLLLLGAQVNADSTTDAPKPKESELPPIKERLLTAGKAYLKGGRIPVDYEKRAEEDAEAGAIRLTDHNWKEVVEEGDKDLVWVIMLHGDFRTRGSPQYLEAHTEAIKLANESDAESLKNVRWARMDYVDEWRQCARWLTTRPPKLIIASNGGRDLHFFSTRMFPAKGEVIVDFIEKEGWKSFPRWESRWGPGGSMSYVVERYVVLMDFFGNTVGQVPAVVWMLGSGWAVKQISSLMFAWGAPAAPNAAGMNANNRAQLSAAVRARGSAAKGGKAQ